jgi:glutathione synthase/RimK-type ligase-like ATP-grasp enzyme
MKRELTTIGSKTVIDFPQLGLLSVPAKIDTGADSSSIWATNIVQKDTGELTFTLFAPHSPFYTGKVISVTDYTLISVKNSFGQTEYRYKAKLQVKIAGRTINTHFTLANRSKNSQPILIGRQTLRGKFIVDVAKKTNATKKRLLLLSVFISDNVAAFIKGVEANDPHLSVTHTTYDNLQFSFDKGRTRITLRSTGEDISLFDIVHLKTSVERDVTATVARYMEHRGRKVIDGEAVRHFPASSKLYQYDLLSHAGILVPKSLFLMPNALIEEGSYELIADKLGLPFVLKDIHTSRGRNNEVIRDKKAYDEMVQRAAKETVYLVAQSFVPNNGDYRFLVMGQKIVLAIWRRRQDSSTHLNNTSQGGFAELHDLSEIPSKVQMDSLKALKAVDRDIAGVDMVRDTETGKWYCFEVNDGPQIASGAFTEEKQKAYATFIKRELEK